MNDNIMGKRIRAARGDQSLRAFAKELNISHTHLDSLEKGYDPRTGKKVSITLETLNKISAGTGLSVDYLLGRSDNPNPPNKEKSPLDKELEGVDFALSGEVRDLTEEEKQDIIDFIKFKKSQRK